MIWRRLGAILLLAFATACSDATGIDTSEGLYTLVSINGEELPFVLAPGVQDRVEVSAGSIHLKTDGTASSSRTANTTVGGDTTTDTETDSGTWIRNGTAVFITWSDGTLHAGTQTDDELSIAADGFVFLYRR